MCVFVPGTRFCVSVFVPACLSVCLPMCLSVFLSVCLSVCLFVCVSECLSARAYFVYGCVCAFESVPPEVEIVAHTTHTNTRAYTTTLTNAYAICYTLLITPFQVITPFQ